MKYLVISDIHGCLKPLEDSIKAFKDFNCDKIICLGDILYHGPRNDIQETYNPKKCIELLNSYSDYIISVKGNCDAEVDQMVLNFKIDNDKFLNLNGLNIYLCHGHHLENVPSEAKIVFHGHDHDSKIKSVDGIIEVDPGSISIPKGDKISSFGILEDSVITIYDFNYNIKHQMDLK